MDLISTWSNRVQGVHELGLKPVWNVGGIHCRWCFAVMHKSIRRKAR